MIEPHEVELGENLPGAHTAHAPGLDQAVPTERSNSDYQADHKMVDQLMEIFDRFQNGETLEDIKISMLG